jgi:hypothetical protein
MNLRSVMPAAGFVFAASALLTMPCASRAALLPYERSTPAFVADMVVSNAAKTMQDVGPFRVMLAVLPAEPFLTKAQAERGASGMLAVGGASPVDPSAPSHPNHHLVIHVYDRTDGRVLRAGHVTMSFTRMNHGSVSGAPVIVPVVEMEAAGKGPQSTHYGNNVFMRAGAYRVAVSINGSARTVFTVQLL